MSIDKALYQAPKGIEALSEEESPLEIEIVNPDEVTIGKDGMEIDITPDEGEEGFGDNLAEYLTESELLQISGVRYTAVSWVVGPTFK